MAKQTQTAERTQNQNSQPRDASHNAGSVAVIQPARLPYHPIYEERYGINGVMWRALVEAIYPSAKTVEGVILAVTYCRERNLDVMKKPVHVVPIWDNKKKAYVEGIWEGIASLRTTASRTQVYAGCDETEFGPLITRIFKGNVGYDDNPTMKEIELTFPEWARITVYRIVQGVRCAFPGPKVAWLGSYGTVKKTDVPNEKWEDDPSYMLEKCAEAAALRKAFPEELGGTHAAEEMYGRNRDGDDGEIQTVNAKPATERPTRTTVKEQRAAARNVAKEQTEHLERHGIREEPVDVDVEEEDETTDGAGDQDKPQETEGASQPAQGKQEAAPKIDVKKAAKEILSKIMDAKTPEELDGLVGNQEQKLVGALQEKLHAVKAGDGKLWAPIAKAVEGKREHFARSQG